MPARAVQQPSNKSLPKGQPLAPNLSQPLAYPMTLTGGPRSHLVTLMDAAIMIRDMESSRQARPVWDRAAAMILLAAQSGEAADIAEATRQLHVALNHDNCLKN